LHQERKEIKETPVFQAYQACQAFQVLKAIAVRWVSQVLLVSQVFQALRVDPENKDRVVRREIKAMQAKREPRVNKAIQVFVVSLVPRVNPASRFRAHEVQKVHLVLLV
jgi:hypothetical protein